MTAEMIYERRWALTVLERVMSRLKDEYRAAGNAALFDSLKQLLPDEPGAPSQAEIAARLGMTENAIRQAFYRFRQRYQSLLREEIAHTVATPGDIEDELRHLIAVVGRNAWESFTETTGECASDPNNDQGNQNLPEVRRQDFFRRAGRALCQMCAENCAGNFPDAPVAAGDDGGSAENR